MNSIVVIAQDQSLRGALRESLNGTYRQMHLSDIAEAIDVVLNEMPDLMIIQIDGRTFEVPASLGDIRKDPIFRQLPILAVIDDRESLPDLARLPVEDYILRSSLEREIALRVNICIARQERTTEINPLTRLPGNISINKHIQECLDAGRQFALGYADIDNFKPFNDIYGFSRGDDVIRMTGRIIFNVVKERQPEGSFVGHIGGDDFIFIMDPGVVVRAAEGIIRSFDQIVPLFYNERERTNGTIEAMDRHGQKRAFPVMALSIGITSNEYRPFTHFGEISTVATELKQFAKKARGSCFKIDRRRPGSDPSSPQASIAANP